VQITAADVMTHQQLMTSYTRCEAATCSQSIAY